ncbi:MAG: hypothetical protein V7K77_05110 [Nostoc sp.]|uniref:hypothetical protein n=1 Tax=Nostoc sp. TaxID=1180 RepID=UPI002FF8887B
MSRDTPDCLIVISFIPNKQRKLDKGKYTDKILSLVNEEFLSAEGYRKAKSE